MPIGWCTIEELVPENSPAAGKRVNAACRSEKPSDRCKVLLLNAPGQPESNQGDPTVWMATNTTTKSANATHLAAPRTHFLGTAPRQQDDLRVAPIFSGPEICPGF
jgi:hypothetical protein